MIPIFSKKPDNKFFLEYYRKFSENEFTFINSTDFINAKKQAAGTLHRKLKGKRRILSFGIGNGITENELLCFDNHYKIDGIDFFRDPNWDSRISHKKTIDECNNNEYEAILFNSSIYNCSDKDLEQLLSEIKSNSLVNRP